MCNVCHSTLIGVIYDCLRDQHSVQGRTTQQLISGDEQVQAVGPEHQRLSDATHLDVVRASGGEGHGVQLLCRVVDQANSRSIGQQLSVIRFKLNNVPNSNRSINQHYIDSHLARTAVTGRSVSRVMASECARRMGTRTAVQEMCTSSLRSSKIFSVSHTTFISSFV